MTISRRDLLKGAGAISVFPFLSAAITGCANVVVAKASGFQRVRPSNPGWPSPARWKSLETVLKGKLIAIESPLDACVGASQSVACASLFKELKNPYFIGDNVALTETVGWADAWTTAPSVYAVAAETAADVAAAVNFARENRLRLVVKGGGHSYLGTSNSADSLLIWTRRMDKVTMHDAFVGQGCSGKVAAKPAVSVGAGAIWMRTYNKVVTRHGRYVQGGGCGTVGVAGLIQSGGFGSFSKNYGTAAASLLEAEIVTADGKILIVNRCSHPELFWALKGGGGGSWGVVTRITLQTHDLPEKFGAYFGTVKAKSDTAYRRLLEKFIAFYAENLFNPHWGEQVSLNSDNSSKIYMVFQGINKAQAHALWKPFFDWIRSDPDMAVTAAPNAIDMPARRFWDPAFLKRIPGLVFTDDRPGASSDNVFWTGNLKETGQYLHSYQSAWIPGALLEKGRQARLVDAFYAASRHFNVSLHCNKGLAGGRPEAIERSRDTAMNPAVLNAFALVIIAAGSEPVYPGVPGHEPNVAAARADAVKIGKAMKEIYRAVPKNEAGAYVSESDYFDTEWAQSYWGPNYPRLQAAKKKYDPEGLFFVHSGVGTEGWSKDGFTRKA
ncbi:FAD-binding oxidoreductase [Paralcaligenes ginsengisoli]